MLVRDSEPCERTGFLSQGMWMKTIGMKGEKKRTLKGVYILLHPRPLVGQVIDTSKFNKWKAL